MIFKAYIGKRYLGQSKNWARALRLIYENMSTIPESGYAKVLRDGEVIMILDLDLPIKDHPR